MKAIFMGTGAIALKILEKLNESENEVVCVVTQPDKPNSRRGGKIEFGEVKKYALENSLELFQPQRVSVEESLEKLKEYGADVAVVCSFGQLLKANVLNAFKFGCINVHASLLEAYRGAAPINRVIMDGQSFTGVTVMYMDEGLDTGDMMISEKIAIDEEETFGSLSQKICQSGGELIVKALELLEKGNAPRVKQDDSKSNYAKKIEKADKFVSFTAEAEKVHNLIRGLDPLPTAEGRIAGKTVKFFGSTLCKGGVEQPCGTIITCDKSGMTVACKDGAVKIKRVKPEGKAEMDAKAFYNGLKDKPQRFE